MTERRETAEFVIEPLGSHYDRAAFTCGVPALDTYFQRQARQDTDRNLAAVFVLTADSEAVAGFYTLSACVLEAAELPESHSKKLPHFPIPATLLGRMAVNSALHGQGLGKLLLMHALEQAWVGSHRVASWAVVVDAKQGAREFYRSYTFKPFPRQQQRLFLPMRNIERLVPAQETQD